MRTKKEKTSGLDNLLKIRGLKKIETIGQEARGLTFRRRRKARALLFEFSKPVNLKIHSLFVFFPFVAIWIDKDNKLIKKKIVRPWKISVGVGEPFTKLIEVPINDFYRREIKELLKLD
jgi:uncharacterized membrane protein (UPF0127 family)